ncbi:hypothetical protein Tco_0024542 [Tanacetum coccineum]
MEDTLSKFMSESAKRHEENSNFIKEIQATTDAAIRNQGASIKNLEIQIRQMSEVLQERGFGSLPSSTEMNSRDQVKSISTTIKADSHSIHRIGSSKYAVSTRQNSKMFYKSRQTMIPFPSRLDNHYYEEEEGNYGPKFTKAYGALHINNAIPRKEKDPGRASVSVMPLLTYLNLGLGELAHTKVTVELMDRTVKYPKGIAKNILEDYFKGRGRKIIFKSVKPASSLIKRVYMLSLRERMELDLEARLLGETLVLNRSLDPLLEDYIKLNDLNEPFELRRNQGDDLMPTIEEGENLFCCDGFCSFRNMEDYCDEGMGDVIFGEPFLREVGIKASQFEGMITLYNGDDDVTYQMVLSHLRFKCHTNEQCNKIPPLLKVSEKDEKNGISHAYQKAYKKVLQEF